MSYNAVHQRILQGIPREVRAACGTRPLTARQQRHLVEVLRQRGGSGSTYYEWWQRHVRSEIVREIKQKFEPLYARLRDDHAWSLADNDEFKDHLFAGRIERFDITGQCNGYSTYCRCFFQVAGRVYSIPCMGMRFAWVNDRHLHGDRNITAYMRKHFNLDCTRQYQLCAWPRRPMPEPQCHRV